MLSNKFLVRVHGLKYTEWSILYMERCFMIHKCKICSFWYDISRFYIISFDCTNETEILLILESLLQPESVHVYSKNQVKIFKEQINLCGDNMHTIWFNFIFSELTSTRSVDNYAREQNFLFINMFPECCSTNNASRVRFTIFVYFNVRFKYLVLFTYFKPCKLLHYISPGFS